MSDPDLGKAIEQAVLDIHDDYTVEPDVEDGNTAIWGEPVEVAETVLTAALPDVLDAYAAKAEADVRRVYEAECAARWLRAEAARLRGKP